MLPAGVARIKRMSGRARHLPWFFDRVISDEEIEALYEAGDSYGSDEQTEYVRKALEDNKNVRWTFVFMHQPIFKGENPDDEAVAYKDWEKLKPLLENRPNTTIFASHEHRYQKYKLGDQKYYILSTTGGSGVYDHPEDSACRFDHIVWVTMTDDGPAIANLMLEGIQDGLKNKKPILVIEHFLRAPFRMWHESEHIPCRISNSSNIVDRAIRA